MGEGIENSTLGSAFQKIMDMLQQFLSEYVIGLIFKIIDRLNLH